MKLPEIRTHHKIRDAKICMMYADAEHTQPEIADIFKISVSRVKQILYKNRDYLTVSKEYEKAKRIHWLKRQINKRDTTRKDTADLIEQLRKEIEGDKPVVDNSQHVNYIFKWKENPTGTNTGISSNRT